MTPFLEGFRPSGPCRAQQDEGAEDKLGQPPPLHMNNVFDEIVKEAAGYLIFSLDAIDLGRQLDGDIYSMPLLCFRSRCLLARARVEAP